ncbi:MAG: DNA internalization-related competence protein ComEC/Rec2 [Fidelibacterota bacterium]
MKSNRSAFQLSNLWVTSGIAFKKRPMVFLCLAFLGGILLGLVSDSFYLRLVGLVLGLSFFLWVKKDQWFLVGLLILVFILGWWRMANRNLTLEQEEQHLQILEEQTIRYRGIIKERKPTSRGFKYRVRNISLESDSVVLHVNWEYFVYLSDDCPCEPGDTLEGDGTFTDFPAPRNPGDFHFQNFYHRQGIFGRVFQDRHQLPACFPNQKGSLTQGILSLRSFIKSQIRKFTSPEAAGLLTALLLGDKSQVDPEIKDTFVATGVVHVLAVSGLHVGYVLIILMIIVNFSRLPWGWDRLAIVLGLALFVALTGGKASVVRASLMAGLYVLAPVVNRAPVLENILATAALGLLAWDPFNILNTGFLLSFTAVISIVFFYRKFEEWLPEKMRVSRIQNKGLQFVWGLFLVSLSAQIGTLPLVVTYFHRLPLIALLANVIIVPLVGILVAEGFMLLFLGWIPGIGGLLGNTIWGLTKLITGAATLFSNVPYASLNVSRVSVLEIGFYFLGLTALVWYLDRRHRAWAFILTLFMINVSVWNWAWRSPKLEVIFLDVGQGDATLIRFPNAKTMLIDGGPRTRYHDAGKEQILPVLNYLGINHLTWIVMTHPHNDHIGGFRSLLTALPVDTVWDTSIDFDSWAYQHLLKLIKERNVAYLRPQRGQYWRMSPHTVLYCLAPDSLTYSDGVSVNNRSLVLKLRYGSTTFLFTGDLEYEGEALLLPYESILDSEVLKVAHHGSITGTTDWLLTAVHPRLAVIPVGRKNKFDHPSPFVLERLRSRGITIHRTDQEGALWLRSDGQTVEEVSWR